MAKKPRWLLAVTVMAIHDELLRQHGGASGLRDESLLESALARPQHRHAYGEKDLFQLASTLAAGLAWNHPFVDGNKRTAFMAAYTFLGDNGLALRAPQAEAVIVTVALAEKRLREEEFAGWLRQHSLRQAAGAGGTAAARVRAAGKPSRKPRARKTAAPKARRRKKA
jgi:death on curing protein